MSATEFTIEAATAAGIATVGSDKGSQAVHDLVVAYAANRRTGSANTKTRAEVAGNNRKMYRQKGTAIVALPSSWVAASCSARVPVITLRR